MVARVEFEMTGCPRVVLTSPWVLVLQDKDYLSSMESCVHVFCFLHHLPGPHNLKNFTWKQVLEYCWILLEWTFELVSGRNLHVHKPCLVVAMSFAFVIPSYEDTGKTLAWFFLPQMAENNLSNIVSQQARLVKRKGAGWQVQDWGLFPGLCSLQNSSRW